MMDIHVNGEPRTLATATTLAALVESLTGERAPRGVAVARNGEVVPRDAWETPVATGDAIEIVRAVEGG
jgi:sulfur carrier protein